MDIVQKFAPMLFFSRFERHLPGSPETFRENARFRQSNYKRRRDRGWNRSAARWERSDRHGRDYQGTDWQTILDEIRKQTETLRPGLPVSDGMVTRPRDSRNLFRKEDGTRGFFLELRERYARFESGARVDQTVPIYYDTHRFDVDERPFVALSYWFFYIYNWHIVLAHEGDWEHITLYFEEERFNLQEKPAWIYFAAHNGGHLISAGCSNLAWEHETHPRVYVSPWGHPSYPSVPAWRTPEFSIIWRTWEWEILPIENALWKLYDGAWGEVGETAHSTGPLGPYFKRGRETVTLSRGRREE